MIEAKRQQKALREYSDAVVYVSAVQSHKPTTYIRHWVESLLAAVSQRISLCGICTAATDFCPVHT